MNDLPSVTGIVAEVRERFGDRVTLLKTLQAQGMTFDQFRKPLICSAISLDTRTPAGADAATSARAAGAVAGPVTRRKRGLGGSEFVMGRF